MEVGAGDLPAEADEEYMQFFRSLGIVDNQKVGFLARTLEAFYDLAIKLDQHLAPTGAVLHAAISRMCQADNPMSAPQHRWFRVQDRLGLFSDGDGYSSRVINMRLAYAYRHQELDALSGANALRLKQLRIAAARAGGDQLRRGGDRDASLAGDVEVPEGGTLVRNDGAAPPGGGAQGKGNAEIHGNFPAACGEVEPGDDGSDGKVPMDAFPLPGG